MKPPILIVEDSDTDFFITFRTFRIIGTNNPIFRCETGDDALDYLFHKGSYRAPESAPRPGIILLDLGLPGTQGRDVLKIIKRHDGLKQIPVIIMSSSTRKEDITGCYDDGANSYICKPNHLEGVRNTIQNLKSYWLDTASLPNGVFE